MDKTADPLKIIKVQAQDGKTGEQRELAYANCKVVGNGSFGVVFQAKLVQSGEEVAIKKVLQDKRFKVGFRDRVISRLTCRTVNFK